MQSHPHPFAALRAFRRWRWSRAYLFPAAFAIASMSVLVVGLTNGLTALPPPPPDALPATVHALWSVLVAVALMAIHLGYLALMAHNLVYEHPVDRNLGATPYVFLLIAAAYILAAIVVYVPEILPGPEAGPETDAALAERSVHALFAIAYGLLFAHGIRVTKRAGGEMLPRTAFSLRYFLAVDAVFCVAFLLLALVRVEFGAMHLGTLPVPVGPKDVLILVSVLVYAGGITSLRNAVRRLEWNSAYANYLRHVDLVADWSTGFPGAAEAVGRQPVWVDYGGGSGERLIEMLELLYPGRLPPLRALHHHDSDTTALAEAHDRLVERLGGQGVAVQPVETRGAMARLVRQRADVVVVSHLFYDPPVAQRILGELAGLRPGGWAIVRVTGATGMFRAISMLFSGRLVAPSSHHVVPEIGMRELCRRHGFRTVQRCRIAQGYRITDPDAIANLARWCDIRHGAYVGDAVRDYVATLEGQGIRMLPDDDDVYFLRREA